MQKIFSARIDEAALGELDRVTRQLRISKRQFLEDAIHRHAQALAGDEHGDVWSETAGAWQRRETPATTVRRARQAFRRAFDRHHSGDARLRR